MTDLLGQNLHLVGTFLPGILSRQHYLVLNLSWLSWKYFIHAPNDLYHPMRWVIVWLVVDQFIDDGFVLLVDPPHTHNDVLLIEYYIPQARYFIHDCILSLHRYPCLQPIERLQIWLILTQLTHHNLTFWGLPIHKVIDQIVLLVVLTHIFLKECFDVL